MFVLNHPLHQPKVVAKLELFSFQNRQFKTNQSTAFFSAETKQNQRNNYSLSDGEL